MYDGRGSPRRRHDVEPVKRVGLTGYAVVGHLAFVLVVAWAVAFLADLPLVTGIDHGAQGPAGQAVALDLGLLGIFAVHHSIMARASAKRVLTTVVPAVIERATFVLVADAFLALVLWQWHPIAGSVWEVTGQPWQALLWWGYGAGWAIAVASILLVDHLAFLGVRQTLGAGARRDPEPLQERWLFAIVRHPLMLGLLIAVWCTPRMSVGHLVLATGATAYIAIGVRLEERDLRRHRPHTYAAYAARVPALLPYPRPNRTCPVRHSPSG